MVPSLLLFLLSRRFWEHTCSTITTGIKWLPQEGWRAGSGGAAMLSFVGVMALSFSDSCECSVCVQGGGRQHKWGIHKAKEIERAASRSCLFLVSCLLSWDAPLSCLCCFRVPALPLRRQNACHPRHTRCHASNVFCLLSLGKESYVKEEGRTCVHRDRQMR